ncbi:hypothetical protein [Polaromonas sp. CG9_12]|uniref:hypothetical protein n=1 Tax=Polaromonas sp. CG_9.11 TaxID=2787730 RepID=UPI0004DDD986|nr:hypothetical protein [Polaromonas sp. CG_9.11]MBG6074372.1 NADH dehydrogenase FAD-containing subunit [Polaromonas sp. CG_9.11]CDS54507.1 hypothetical protein [Polaromonas sp. CG9_12]
MPCLAQAGHPGAGTAACGLLRDETGFVAVSAFVQSSRHPAMFAPSQMASRVDAPNAQSAVYAVRSGLPLRADLRTEWQGQSGPVCRNSARSTG